MATKKTAAAAKAPAPRADLLEKEPKQLHIDFAQYMTDQTGEEWPSGDPAKDAMIAVMLRGPFQSSEINQARLSSSAEERESAATLRKEAAEARAVAKAEAEEAKAAKKAEPKAAPAKKVPAGGKKTPPAAAKAAPAAGKKKAPVKKGAASDAAF